ncbi:MAG: hypothetical protein KF799_13660 [Bdellovibrionales bacterium]|nr:hypothetical protein [Bdellovibrionales bacterium]
MVKFLFVSLTALLCLAACQPKIDSHMKSVTSEAQEEQGNAFGELKAEGPYLQLGPESLKLAARKQGVAWARSRTLRPYERAEIDRLLANLDLSSMELWTDDKGDLLLVGRYNNETPTYGTILQVNLKKKNGGMWIGETKGQQKVVVTCLPLENRTGCDPKEASVIELLSQQTMSNHRPRTISFLYGSTEAVTSIYGMPSFFSGVRQATLRSVLVLNPKPPQTAALHLILHDSRRLAFSAKQGKQMSWDIEDHELNYSLNGFRVVHAQTDSNRIVLEIEKGRTRQQQRQQATIQILLVRPL